MTVQQQPADETIGLTADYKETLAGLDERSLAASQAWRDAARWPWVDAAAWIAGADATLMQTLCGWRYRLDRDVGESDSGVWLIASAHIGKVELEEGERLLRQRLKNGAIVGQLIDGSTATLRDWDPSPDNLSYLFESYPPDVPEVFLPTNELRRIWPEAVAATATDDVAEPLPTVEEPPTPSASRPKRGRGRRKGTGQYQAADGLIVEDIRQRILAGEATAPWPAAVLMSDRIQGSKHADSHIKRVVDLYYEKYPAQQ